MALVQRAIQEYHYVIEDLADPRTKDWWLVSSPGPLMTILAAYLYFCIKAGPQYMKDKKPYQLKYAVMIYNIFQVAISIYIVYTALAFVVIEKYQATCHSVDFSNTPNAIRWAGGVWLYYFAKITELLDTVFFVLRKKTNQISFLHLYHHTTMPIIAWLGIKYAAGGSSVPEGAINSFIHVLMYSYYLISGLGPEYQKYLWWKKYITTLQLIQFCIVIYFSIDGLLATSCNYPKFQRVLVLTNCIAFFYMFSQFYYNSYIKNQKSKHE